MPKRTDVHKIIIATGEIRSIDLYGMGRCAAKPCHPRLVSGGSHA